MPAIPPIDALITFLPVRDLDSTERFYRDHLGLRLAIDQGRCRIYEAGRTGYLGFCLSDDLPQGGRIVLTLVTEDPDRWHQRLRQAGLAPGPVEENETYRIRHFYLADPDGYLVEFQRFWDDDWRQGGRYPGTERLA